MCTYLDQVGSTYYFRRPVPQDLLGHFLTATGKPRVDWKDSLRTKDREEAKRRVHQRTSETDREIDAMRAKLAATPSVPGCGYVASDAELRSIADSEELWRLDAEARAFEDDALEYERTLARPKAQLTPEQRLAAHLLWEERQRGNRYKRKIRNPLNAPDAHAKPGLVKPAVPLLATFEAYAAEQKIKPSVAAEWRASVEKLIAFAGHDDAARLTLEEMDRWKDSLIGAETNRGRPRTARTVKTGYINPIRATLNYAIEKRRLKENVASKVVVRVPKQAKLRERDFTRDEAKAILSATLKPVDSRLSEGNVLARRWIPWLCLYTGARVNELSQLRKQDVKQVDGVWCITITPEAGTVKANAARTVPLHAHLIEQGFPTAIADKADGPLFYDPSMKRTEGESARHFKKVGERLRDWIRESVGIVDPNVQPNHGWRHLFKTRAFEAGVPERVADAIQGHAPKSVGQTYGNISIAVMKEAVNRMPRFDIKPD